MNLLSTMKDELGVLIDIEDVILQRIEQIEEDDPDLVIGYEIIGDENRGIIITALEDLLISVEFVESDLSWRRSSRSKSTSMQGTRTYWLRSSFRPKRTLRCTVV